MTWGRAGLLVACLALLAGLGASTVAATDEPEPRVRLITSAGAIDLQLYPERAPATVANFLMLVDTGFYEGLIFHRVEANFVIQAGGYDAALAYREPPDTVVNESANGLRNVRGTVAMARQAEPDSADSQFFVNMNDNAHLDPQGGRPGYTVFGRVVGGMEVAEAIELSDTGIQAGMAAVPITPIVIEKVERLP